LAETRRAARSGASGRQDLAIGFFGLVGLPLLLGFLEVAAERAPARALLGAVFAANVASFVACLVVSLGAHELGHGLAGTLLGFKTIVTVGVGRTLFEARAFGQTIILRALPFFGLTFVAPRRTAFVRSRVWLVYAAGPAVHVFVLILVWRARGLPATVGEVFETHFLARFCPIEMLVLSQCVLLVNLLPFVVDLGPGAAVGKQRTDGLALLQIPFMKEAAIDEMHAAYFLLEGFEEQRQMKLGAALEWYERGAATYPGSIHLGSARGVALTLLGRFGPAREVFLGLLPAARLPIERLVLVNNVAWSSLVLRDPALLEEAVRYSGEALTGAPDFPIFKGTRGAALVCAGRLGEGSRLLAEALAEYPTNEQKAMAASWLAIGEGRRGDAPAEKRWLERARELDPSCHLLDLAADHAGWARYFEAAPRVDFAAELAARDGPGPFRAVPVAPEVRWRAILLTVFAVFAVLAVALGGASFLGLRQARKGHTIGATAPELELILDDLEAPVEVVAFSPGGDFLAASSDRGGLGLWSVAGGRATFLGKIPARFPGRTTALAFSPRADRLAVGGEHDLRLVTVPGKELASPVDEGRRHTVSAVAFSPDGDTLASVTEESGADLWAARDGSFLRAIDREARARVLAFSPSGDRIATVGRSGRLRISSVRDGQVLGELGVRGQVAAAAVFVAGGEQVVTATTACDLTLWSVPDARAIRSLLGAPCNTLAVAVSPTGERAAAEHGSRLLLWSSEEPRRVRDLDSTGARCLSFVADGHRVATAAWDGVRVFRVD
jgi:tetratricopeptide (TPR) repeat protein